MRRPHVLDRRALLALGLLAPALRATAAGASLYGLGLRFVDDRGALRELAEWRGRPVVITMAYGACRSLCSTTLRTLEELQVLADRRAASLDIVVASLDPAEDTPADWAAFRRARHLDRANWTFLSGTPDATRALGRFLGIRSWNYDEHVMHDFKLLRLDPAGAIAASLDWHQSELERLL
ncbi:MAG TPA: SCO family protein [Albitalea sp.]|uniref:SCO family protein n=1 Tax=Piscinibacter sp. TaxID=1903157 RepID=UPI002ED09273